MVLLLSWLVPVGTKLEVGPPFLPPALESLPPSQSTPGTLAIPSEPMPPTAVVDPNGDTDPALPPPEVSGILIFWVPVNEPLGALLVLLPVFC